MLIPPLSPMVHQGSYLWRLRQEVGNDLVLMHGAMVAIQRDDQRVLLARRADDGTWCLPAGAAEPDGSFAGTAIDELAEEAGVEVVECDLVPFGCLSESTEAKFSTWVRPLSRFTLPPRMR